MARIAIIGGAGYVGLTYAVALADWGHEVVGIDVDAEKVAALNEGRAPIYEPELDHLLARGLDSGGLRCTTDGASAIGEAEFVFVCVGTPADQNGQADLRQVLSAVDLLAKHGRGHTIVVNKSTLPIGTVEFVSGFLARHAAPGATFAVVANPEFLRQGSAIRDIYACDRIVLGSDDPIAIDRVAALYAHIEAPVLRTDPRSAEMIKYASNAFLATKISFVNEVALICERLGADVVTVARGMGLDPRIGPRFLQAGVGFGGSCFPKDVRALAAMAERSGLDTNMLNAVLTINGAMRRQIVAKLERSLGALAGRSIAILGLAFKPETDDVRESPSLDVIRQLVAAGARVRATDPVATARVAALLPWIELTLDPYAAVLGADAVVLMTEWESYRSLDLPHLANAMRGNVLIDARNVLDPAAVVAAGFAYEGIGRSANRARLADPIAPAAWLPPIPEIGPAPLVAD